MILKLLSDSNIFSHQYMWHELSFSKSNPIDDSKKFSILKKGVGIKSEKIMEIR